MSESGSNKAKIIFVDMDGVLCNFAAAAFNAHGDTYDPATYPRKERDMRHIWGVEEEQFWEKIHARGADFWSELACFDWTHDLLAIARERGEAVKILTSPSRSADCFAGKYLWWQRHVGRDTEFIPCKSKHLLAAPDRILIDDNDLNIEKWRAAGGIGILFPQPWNAMHELTGTPMDYVRSAL